MINDLHILQKIKKTCFTKDTRASWIGLGIAETDNNDYKNYANWANEHFVMYLGFLPHITGRTNALDVGCGSGYSTLNLKSNFDRVDGIDYDIEIIDFAKENNSGDGINYFSSDFFTHQFNEKYDCVFALEILEHILSDKHYVFTDKCLSLLSDGGCLFITTPNEPNSLDAGHHRGMLNKDRAKMFFDRYGDRFTTMWYYDNKSLDPLNPQSSIISGGFDDYLKSDGINRSHFAFVLRN